MGTVLVNDECMNSALMAGDGRAIKEIGSVWSSCISDSSILVALFGVEEMRSVPVWETVSISGRGEGNH
jgi:hypothetical protein